MYISIYTDISIYMEDGYTVDNVRDNFIGRQNK